MKIARPSLAMALGAGALLACGSDPATDAARTASGVGIVADGCGLTAHIGSGVVVSEEGQVATVAHTIQGAHTVTVVDAMNAEHAADVIAFDPDADLAVLRVPTLDAPPLALDDFSSGSGSILTWGRDDGVREVGVDVVKQLSITIEDIYVENTVQRSGLEFTGPVENGDSGGPVLDGDGDVIGIIYANARGRDSVGFATDTAEISAVLDAARATGDGVANNGTCF